MAIPFNVVKGSEAAIKSCDPKQGYLWFALDTRKIYYSDGSDFISMGGNSSVFYGTLTWDPDHLPDSDQVDFDFSLSDIEGEAIPNINDLILNSDGCFYRVTATEGTGAATIIKTIKLTIAGSGSGGQGGGGTITTSVITIAVQNATKYFLDTEENPTFSFDVHSTLESGNQISKITYTIGSRTFEDDTPHAFGTITLDLKNYFNSISENGTNLSFVVEDIYGARKTSSVYSLRKVHLILNADTSNNKNILQATNKQLQYRALLQGSSSISNIVLTYNIYVEGSNTPINTIEKSISSLTGSVISQDFDFAEIDTIGDGIGAYSLKISATGTAGGQIVTSNELTHSIISYGEDPILVAYLPTTKFQQFEDITLSYEIAKTAEDNSKARISIDIDEETSIQEVEYNQIYDFNLYFETTGYHSVQVKDTFGHIQSFNNIYITPFDGSIQVIDNNDIDLKLNLTAKGRNNNEIAANRSLWADKKRTGIATLSDFVWGNVNGWLRDANGANMLHISSGANLIVNGYEPFGLNSRNEEGMVTGKSIELDFAISEVTDYSAPLITCLSYNGDTIQCGFQITGEAATFNTYNIKATGSSIIDDDDHQEYNTQVQGLTTKFTEGERIHLTWVIQKKTEAHPMIKTYINGIVSGISEYTGGTNSDSIAQNETLGAEKALIKINSNTGTVDVYNIRVFDKVLSDRQVLENYIATLATTEEKSAVYNNNIGLLDSNGSISINNIESGNYNMRLPYIKFTGGGQCRKDDDGYHLTNADGTNHLPRAKKDYRLINHFDFVYPTDTSRNVDLYSEVDATKDNLVNGVVMYGQGTSSMEYPVKNLRIKFKMKKDGKKVKFQVNQGTDAQGKNIADYPVDILTLKADYMESASSHNTGTANLVFDSLEALGFHTPGQEYWNAQNPNYKTLTAIRGYPIICFFRPDENSDFEYIGRYNLNMDKSSKDAFGFLPVPAEEADILEDGSNIEFGWIKNEGIQSGTNLNPAEHPYVNAIHCYEFLNNASNLDNFIVGDTGLSFHDLFYQEVLDEDNKLVANWQTSFESRYPEESMDIEAFYQLCAWINSTNTLEATDEELNTPVTYGNQTYLIDNASYRLAKFKNEFEDHFNKNFVLFYYILTHVLLMIDSRAKNMMMATWDNQHWYPIFYDMDTMLGLNNYGYNKFDYNVEDNEELYPNVFNGQNSVLWLNVRACFGSDINALYNNMQKDGGLTYGNLLHNYNIIQADMWNEIMYNYDANYKYIRPYAEGYYDGKNLDENKQPILIPAGTKNYLYAAQGSRSMHRRYWLKNRIAYFDGKYLSDNYKTDRFMMRLYTPNAGAENYFRANDVTAETFRQDTYYTRTGDETIGFTYTLATSFEAGTTYYEKAGNRLATSLAIVPPSNNFNLTPLHNQYLAVAFGGSNGQTSGPFYSPANTSYLIEAPAGAKYNDTETYVYGASQLKDLGDLSPQYLGLFSFPGETKLERLVLGNKKNGYYNPNFSALTIGNAAPQLKYIDISNTQLKGVLDLSGCQNIEEVYACGSLITNISLPSYGVLNTLRLPSSINTLMLNNQSQLTDETFTLGTYDSELDEYTNSTTATLTTISIEGMPQFNSYNLVKNNLSTLTRYCLRDIDWTISNESIITKTVDDVAIKGIDVFENLLSKNATPIRNGEASSTARAVTGIIHFANDVEPQNMLDLYDHYANIYPDLIFDFDAENIKYIRLYDGNDNIYWSKPIASGATITESFFDSSASGTFTVPKKDSTVQYQYVFENKWYIGSNETDIINGEKPIISGTITKDYDLHPVFSSTIQQYTIKYHINDEIVNITVDYGTPWVDAIPKFIPISKNNEPLSLSNTKVYPFLGYSIYEDTNGDSLFDIEDTTAFVSSNRELYATFGPELVDVTDHQNVFYPAFNFSPKVSYIDDVIDGDSSAQRLNGNSIYYIEGTTITPKQGWTFNDFVLIPRTDKNGNSVIKIGSFAATRVSRVYFEKDSDLRVITNNTFDGCSSLVYFDFPQNLRQIGYRAFINTALTDEFTLKDSKVIYIGPSAFNGCFNRAINRTIIIPGSVQIIKEFGFANLNGVSGMTIQIGSASDLSELDLLKSVSSGHSRGIFGQNSNHQVDNIIFYTNNYTGPEQIISGETGTVESYLTGNSITVNISVISS